MGEYQNYPVKIVARGLLPKHRKENDARDETTHVTYRLLGLLSGGSLLLGACLLGSLHKRVNRKKMSVQEISTVQRGPKRVVEFFFDKGLLRLMSRHEESLASR